MRYKVVIVASIIGVTITSIKSFKNIKILNEELMNFGRSIRLHIKCRII